MKGSGIVTALAQAPSPRLDPPRSSGQLATPWVIVGPTASAKSALAMELARRHRGIELFCVDSMTVYRHMDIGTAKPTAADQREVRHHLVDLVEPDEPFSVVDFQQAYRAALADFTRRAAACESEGGCANEVAGTPRALLVGGAGLYLRAVVDELTPPGRFPEVAAELEGVATADLFDRLLAADPLAASRIVPTNRRRLLRALEVTLGSGKPFSSFGPGLSEYPPVAHRMFGVRVEPDVLAERIEQRYRRQVADGFVDEVRRLVETRPLSRTAAQSLGYREIAAHLRGEMTLDEAIAEAVRATRRFARRQVRWFRRDPRITWIDFDAPTAMADAIETHLALARPTPLALARPTHPSLARPTHPSQPAPTRHTP